MIHKPVVAGIGELLWDLFPTGKQIGGAPCNFAFHAMQAGCESVLISAVGNDQKGKELLNAIAGSGINCDYIQQNNFPTGEVSVSLDKSGLPKYIIHENRAWDNTEYNTKIESGIMEFDAVCFGTLGQRSSVSAGTIQKLLSKVNPDCIKVFDINLRQNFFSFEIINQSLQFADILKLNEDELPVLSNLYGFTGEIEVQLKTILSRFNLKYVVYTLGDKGSFILGNGESSFLKTPKVDVADTVGAGDSFTSVLISGLLKGFPLCDIHETATRAAAFVCTQKGACPVIPFKLF